MSFNYPQKVGDLVTVTHPTDAVWVIELHNGQDNRLTETLIETGLKPALDAVEKHWRTNWRAAQASKDKEGGKGSVIIVGRRDQDKFFSNGLDLASVFVTPDFFPRVYNPLIVRLLTFPIPTVAAINGHSFAGGMMLSLACDYRVMTSGPRNAWMSLNEVHFGAAMPLSFTAVLRAKFASTKQLYRKILLEGHRFVPQEALADGLLDAIVEGGTKEVLGKAVELAEKVGAQAAGGVYGIIRTNLYQDAIELSQRDVRLSSAQVEDTAAKARL